MIELGALENISEIYGYHAGPFGSKIVLKPEGFMTTVFSSFSIKITGKGSHGAYPELSHDPITAACHVHSAMHSIISLGIKSKDLGICTVGTIDAGNGSNSIPETACMTGTIRTGSQEIDGEIIRKLKAIVENVPKAFGCAGELTINEKTSPAVVNSREQGEALMEAIIKVFGKDEIIQDYSNASEDFAYMLQKVKGAFVFCNRPPAIPGVVILRGYLRAFLESELLSRIISLAI